MRWLHVSNHRSGTSGVASRNSSDNSPVDAGGESGSRCKNRNITKACPQQSSCEGGAGTDSSGLGSDWSACTNLTEKSKLYSNESSNAYTSTKVNPDRPSTRFRIADRVLERAGYRLCSGPKGSEDETADDYTVMPQT